MSCFGSFHWVHHDHERSHWSLNHVHLLNSSKLARHCHGIAQKPRLNGMALACHPYSFPPFLLSILPGVDPSIYVSTPSRETGQPVHWPVGTFKNADEVALRLGNTSHTDKLVSTRDLNPIRSRGECLDSSNVQNPFLLNTMMTCVLLLQGALHSNP